MLLLHSLPTCADAGPDLCTLRLWLQAITSPLCVLSRARYWAGKLYNNKEKAGDASKAPML